MKFIKVYDDSILPKYQTPGSVGLDLHAQKLGWVYPQDQCKIGTGVGIALPYGFEAQIRPRSGLSLIGITCHLGTIDTDYRGEIHVVLMNIGRKMFRWQKGQRIAQLVICPVLKIEVEEVDSLGPTGRGDKGFGSTD